VGQSKRTGILSSLGFSRVLRLFLFIGLHLKGHVGAQTSLGVAFMTGEGADKKALYSVKWWSKAAASGDPLAMNNLATTLMNGDGGVPVNQIAAVSWLVALFYPWISSSFFKKSKRKMLLGIARLQRSVIAKHRIIWE